MNQMDHKVGRFLIFILLFWWAICAMAEEDYIIDPHDMVNPRKPIQKESKNIPKEEGTPKTDPDSSGDVDSSQSAKALNPERPKINGDTQTECEKPTTVDIGKQLLKHYVSSLLQHFELKEPSSGSQEYNMIVQLSVHDFEILRKFVSDENKDLNSLHYSSEILREMIKSVSRSHLGTMGKLSIWFEDKYGTSIDAVLKIVAVLLMASVFATLEIRLQMSWRTRFMQLIVLAFIVSIPMTWFELYKAEQIRQQTVAMKDAPADCGRNDSISENWFGAATHMLSSLFTLKDDKCQKYYEHMMIDPFVKVPPTKAVGVTFVRFFLSPLKDVGASLSIFIKELLIDLPLTLYPVAMVLVSVFLFLILFMTFGYSIRLPFFLSIEPSPYHAVTGGASNQQAIENNTKQLMEQIETMQRTLESREAQFTARMNDFERLQKTAIEYSAAINVPDAPPPTIPAAALTQPVAASRSQDVARGSQDSGGGDVLLRKKSTEAKSPIPCSDAELESSMEDSHIIDLPHARNPPSSRNRSSKLPVNQKNNISVHTPTQVTSSSNLIQAQNVSPENIHSQETGAS